MSAEDNTYVRDQNARVDPLYTIGALTVAGLREFLNDLPDDAVVIMARPERAGVDCSPLADVQPCWYLPRSGGFLPIGRDADGNVHEPGPYDLYAVVLQSAD